MQALLAVAAGGAVGAVARYGVARVVLEWAGPSALGTFAVNISGAFALGLLIGLSELRLNLDPTVRVGLTVGVLGSFTTFSTLMYQVVAQAELGSVPQAAGNLLGSLAVGLLVVSLGLALGRELG